MKNRRILYFSRNFGSPSGGVKTAYRHVRILRENGFDAAILLTTVEDADPNGADVPEIIFEPTMPFDTSDIIVIPEGWHNHIVRFGSSPLRTIIFCQNHFYIHDGLQDARDYEELGVDRVFCGTAFIAQGLRDELGYENTTIIPYAIDAARFTPRVKLRQIAYMPRKMPTEASFVQGSFKRRYPLYQEIPWVKIVDMEEADVARILGESAIFVSFSRLDGLGLPPLEAMASGCILTGFLGNGGAEFATPQNGLWCAPEDWRGATDAIASAVDAFGTETGDHLVQEGIKTAAHYSDQSMRDALLTFWSDELER